MTTTYYIIGTNGKRRDVAFSEKYATIKKERAEIMFNEKCIIIKSEAE